MSAAPESPRNVVARVDGLEVTFPGRDGDVRALRGISLEIEQGEIVAVVGESGSGKTVFGLSLLGLLPASPKPVVSGSVMVAGTDMLGGPATARRDARRHRLGAVFQDPLSSLNPTMKVGSQLLERGISRDDALQNLREAGIGDPDRRFRQFPHELSGGLRQRVMIAMAVGASGDEAAARVVTDARGAPALIVADEPTTALDVSVQAQVLVLFDRIRREFGCSIVFVTHDLGVAASIADRIAVFYAGRIRELGTAVEVIESPRHPYTRDLLNSRLTIDQEAARAHSIEGNPPDPRFERTGCAYAPRCSAAREDCEAAHPPLEGEGSRAVACFHPVGAERIAVTEAAPLDAPLVREGSVLELRNVSKTFMIRKGRLGRKTDELHAVDDVTLSVAAGGAVALVGESGSGKTTTLRIATGLLEPDSGEVSWGPNRNAPQLVFQDAGSSLTPWLSVGSQIEERLRAIGQRGSERRDRITEVLGLVGLDGNTARAKPRALSGGQRQRAAIARALASEPQLLVCDEPVSALDASLVIRVLELLESLRSGLGVALLIVTHDLAVARRIADDVLVMYRGRVVEEGPTDEVFRNPAHPYTWGLLDAIPTAEPGRLSPTLRGEPPVAVGRIKGCAFASRCNYVRDRCREEAPPLLSVTPLRKSACHFFEEVIATRDR